MKKMNFTFFTKLMVVLFAVMAINTNLSAQCGPEKRDLILTAANGCNRALQVADIPEALAGTNVQVRKPGGQILYNGTLPSPTLWGNGDVGLEYEVMFMNAANQMCFTFVRIYDQTPPQVGININPTRIRCTDFINGKIPAPGAVIGNAAIGSDPRGTTRVPEPTVNGTSAGNGVSMSRMGWTSAGGDAVSFASVAECNNFSASYVDLDPTALTCPTAIPYTSQTAIRRWTFKDIYNNSISVDQNFEIVRPVILAPATFNVDCRNVTAANIATAGYPGIDWNANGTIDAGEAITSGVDYCGNSYTLISETVMNTCGTSKMYMRRWKVVICGIPQAAIFDQTINVVDDVSPRIGLRYNNYPRNPVRQQVCMGGMSVTEFVYTLVRDRPNEPAFIARGDG